MKILLQAGLQPFTSSPASKRLTVQYQHRLCCPAAGKPLTGWKVYNVPLNPADLGKLHFRGRPSGIQPPVRKSKAAIWSSDLQTFYGENLPDAVLGARPNEGDLAALQQQEEAGIYTRAL